MGHQGPGGVQDDSVADGPRGAGQHGSRRGGVGLRVAAHQFSGVGPRETERGGIECQRVHGPGLHPQDRAGRRGGQLVEPVVAAYHQHTRPARGEHPRHHPGQIGERATHQPGPWLGRIRQRPKKIEHRRHADFSTHGRRVPVRRVKKGREAEPDPDVGEAFRDLLGAQVNAHAQRLERVRPAGQRRRRPVAVFDHRNARRRDHDRRHGGQVDRVEAVTPGPDDVDGLCEVPAHRPRRQLKRMAQHDVGELTDLRRGGALHLHRHRERGDLGRLRAAAHDLVHRPGGLTPRQFPTARQQRQDLRPCGGGAPGRRFR